MSIGLVDKVNKRQSGFMLLEVMLAIVIFSFGVLAIVGLQAVSIKNAGDAKYRVQASFLANEVVGSLWANRSSISASYQTPTDWKNKVAATLPSGVGTVVVAQNVNITTDTQYTVTVTVQWLMPGGEKHKYISVAQINGAGLMS